MRMNFTIRMRRAARALAASAMLLCLAVPALAQRAGESRQFTLAPGDWLDTKIDLRSGDRIRVTATGTLKYTDASQQNGPEGLPRGWRDLIRRLPLASANRGAVLGRVGEDEVAQVFLIGAEAGREAERDGRLFLGVNHDGSEVNGSYRVKVEIVERIAAPAPTAGTTAGGAATPEATPARGVLTDVPIAGISAALWEKIPRRVMDDDGTPGDMVNFLLIGPEQEFRRGLERAGWVIVNRTKKDAVVGALLATLSKKAYVELPMSELVMFERPQDFGYARGEPYAVIAERHHFRLWRAPFTVNGQTVWVGAGTHDVGFDRDHRDGKITHKIDPEVDKERDYIGKSLAASGAVAQTMYYTPPNPVQEAKTAHGQEYRSDGRVLVMLLRGAENDRTSDFASVFCAVLARKNPDGGEWGACSEYLGAAADASVTEKPAAVALKPLPTLYRVLVVPGVFNLCASNAPAFEQGRKYLGDTYGITAEIYAAPNDSSENNAKRIAEYLKDKAKEDGRRYIIIGYSKGGPDVQEALARYPELAQRVAAFVSLAGAAGGSQIADTLPAAAERWMNRLGTSGCQGDMNAAMRSLRKDVRAAFQQSFPRLPVATYSVAAVAGQDQVSKALAETWRVLAAFDRKQDAQLLLPDQIVPNSLFLGEARGDHFAVALPFDKVDDQRLRNFADKNRYPRSALLEAVVRYVIQDLQSR